jgi:flagellar motor switch protein FliG
MFASWRLLLKVREQRFRCMSERAVMMIKEDMEFMGPTRLKTIEESQKRIVSIIRRLEEAGEIQLGRGREDVVV